jgi:hypothetical protein
MDPKLLKKAKILNKSLKKINMMGYIVVSTAGTRVPLALDKSKISGLKGLSVFYRLPTEGYAQGGKFR